MPSGGDSASTEHEAQSTTTSASSSGSPTSGVVTTSGIVTTSGVATTSGAEESTGTGSVIYRAVALPTDVPRIRILKQDTAADLCTWVGLAYGVAGQLAIDAPEGWGAEEAGINDIAASCDAEYPAMFGAVAASTGTGTIEFEIAMGLLPEELDIDVELTFESSLQGTPLTDVLMDTGIVVEFE